MNMDTDEDEQQHSYGGNFETYQSSCSLRTLHKRCVLFCTVSHLQRLCRDEKAERIRNMMNSKA